VWVGVRPPTPYFRLSFFECDMAKEVTERFLNSGEFSFTSEKPESKIFQVSRLVKAESRLLFYRGEFLGDAMKRERVNEGEILQAMRSQGMNHHDVEAVVLETDGSFSVVNKIADDKANMLTNVSDH